MCSLSWELSWRCATLSTLCLLRRVSGWLQGLPGAILACKLPCSPASPLPVQSSSTPSPTYPRHTPGAWSVESTGIQFSCDVGTQLRIAVYSLLGLFGLSVVVELSLTSIGLKGGRAGWSDMARPV